MADAPTPARLLAGSRVLVGIDDTDNLSSPGTGFLAQRLLEELDAAGLGVPLGATRHQLLRDPRVPFTSHNSSACLALHTDPDPDLDAIEQLAARFLRTHSAEGSDPGLAVVATHVPPADRDALAHFGHRAKTELLDQPAARTLAPRHGVRLSGHGGTQDGVIGALAAVGLHLSGTDGLFLWMEGSRTLRAGSWPYGALRDHLPVDDARSLDGRRPTATEHVEVGPWIRPLLHGGDAVLLLEHHSDPSGLTSWRTAPRDVVKGF